MRFFSNALVLLLLATVGCTSLRFLADRGASPPVDDGIDWKEFLGRHDMLWDRLPVKWEDGPWFGNGLVGSLIHRDGENNRLRMRVFRSDVQEHRPQEYGHAGYSRSRLQIGSFYLKPVGQMTGCDWRLSLRDASLEGTITTDAGTIRIRHFVHTDDPVILTELVTSAGERDCDWSWEPAEAMPTRPGYPLTEEEIPAEQAKYKTPYPSKVWEVNPQPTTRKLRGVDVCLQTLVHGGQHATAWTVLRPDSSTQVHLASIAKRWPDEEPVAADDAVAAVQEVAESDLEVWSKRHTDWWHAYYPSSFLSISDTRVETLYWTQIYKLASATRPDHPMMDTAGIWQTPSKWPFVTWNLNVQLCYWLPSSSNRLDMGMSLVNTINKYRDNLIDNVRPVEWQVDSAFAGLNTGLDLSQPLDSDRRDINTPSANLTWALHDCWLMYRHSMDKELLRHKIFPMLRRAVNFQLHLLEERDGRYHLPPMNSPEYPGVAPDCNYELATLRWGCEALLESCRLLKIRDPLIDRWRDVLARLVDYPTDEDGYMIGAGVPFSKAHRHYSHLLMVYPYYLVNVEQPGVDELVRRSLKHFYATNRREFEQTGNWQVFAGYTHTGLASIYAALGDGNEALKHLDGFIEYPYVRRNSLYSEAGPVLESPLSAAQSVHDMLLQSWGDKIRVFPAVPDAWPDVVFRDFRTEGAFLLSAERRGGKTRWVRVTSLAGEPCRIRPSLVGDISVKGVSDGALKSRGDGVYDLDLAKGETALLYVGDEVPAATVQPLPARVEDCHWYGLHGERGATAGR